MGSRDALLPTEEHNGHLRPSFAPAKAKPVLKPADQHRCLSNQLATLYSENITAKILRTATENLVNNNPPINYPETVPQSGENEGHYESREVDFWTSGFFPGCIYSLLERAIKYPRSIISQSHSADLPSVRRKLQELGHAWSEPLHRQALRTDTHDLGFVIMPHMQPRWELFHDSSALETIETAAKSLVSRYDPTVQAIRSWDDLTWHDGVDITSMTEDFLVIIDSMCNMDLIFYAAAHTGNAELADAAIAHSRTLIKSHLRAETSTRDGYTETLYSTVHLVNFSPKTGMIKERRTAQGYHRDSTWSRGQAWGILGYAQVYTWTGKTEFLDAACGLVEYFLLRMETSPACVEVMVPDLEGRTVGRYVPLWDFDAPIEDLQNPLRDTSAGVIAANGMLILSQALASRGEHRMAERYLEAALLIVRDTMDLALAREMATFSITEENELIFKDTKLGKRFDSILKHATVCNNASSFRRNKARDHGLVYADYYLLEFGTRLLRYGLI